MKCVDKGESGLVSKRTGNLPKLAQLIVALPCNQIDMMRESELRIKHDPKVYDTRLIWRITEIVDFLLVHTSNLDCANIKSVTRFDYTGIVEPTLLLRVLG